MPYKDKAERRLYDWNYYQKNRERILARKSLQRRALRGKKYREMDADAAFLSLMHAQAIIEAVSKCEAQMKESTNQPTHDSKA